MFCNQSQDTAKNFGDLAKKSAESNSEPAKNKVGRLIVHPAHSSIFHL